MSTSALKIASAPRPMIPAQPVQGNDIKLPKLNKKALKVITTAATIVPELEAVETVTTMTKTTAVEPKVVTEGVEPIKPLVGLEIPEQVVETLTTYIVVAHKPQPAVVETVVETALEPPKPVVEAPQDRGF
ncbi:hypothetical protein BGZ88_002288 [Linnemannia elongata]|nr:hypothetical protein BGZ88_002288 [Linnemannia elongata]